MKTLSILFVIFFLGTQSLTAQEQKQQIKSNIITSLDNIDDARFNPNPVFNTLKFNSNQTIDMISLYDNNGMIVLQQVPKDNQIALNTLKPGFYLICAYCNGKRVKKGILRKV